MTEFKGNVWDSGEVDSEGNEIWLVGVSKLDILTQGHGRADALVMVEDAIRKLWNEDERDSLEIEILDDGKSSEFWVTDNSSGHLQMLGEMRERGEC